MTLTQRLADYTLSRTRPAIQPEVWASARRFLKDCYGCILAGAYEKATMIAREYGRSLSCRPAASVIGAKGLRTSPCTAAMINGVAAHIHDYDDVSTTVTGHPSVVVLPAALAVGEAQGASGADVLRAYITGVEVMALMGRAFNPQHYSRGWHNTGTLGIFGAAAAAGQLMGLDRGQLVHAFGIAASRSAGLKGNFGTMTKALHAGLAASNGIFSAQMAQYGFTSNPDIMEMEGGFAYVTTGALDRAAVDRFLDAGDSEFLTPGLAFKPYPSCKGTHNGVCAILELREQYGFRASDVERVQVGCQPIALDLLKYPNPSTPLEGKFSMNYCLACALLYGRLTLSHFVGSTIDNPVLCDLMERISMQVNPQLAQGAYFNGTWETEVTVYLKDGRSAYRRVRFAPGDPTRPLSSSELEEKFSDCAAQAISPGSIAALSAQLDCVDQLDDIRALLQSTERALY